MPDEFVFVYGTLRKTTAEGKHNKHPMHRALRTHAEYLCEGHCPGKLYDIGRYPGLIPDPTGQHRVQGEIYRVHNRLKLWRILDAYENFNPADVQSSDYIREKTTVMTGHHGELISWVYHYNLAVKGLRQILSGDYCAPSATTFIR